MSQAALKQTDAHALPTAPDAAGATPMMAQYLRIKAQYPDALLFYRMGDFFELFFEDAVAASAVLDIALTRRGKNGDADVPMCGVPAHAYESYLAKLIRAGFRVAICDQTETPEQAKARGGYKALVTRDVVRVVTPGTLTEDTLLESRAPNYLAALTRVRGVDAVAWLDLSTGDFRTETIVTGNLAATLARISPREILVPERLYAQKDMAGVLALYDRAVTRQPDSLFDDDNARARLLSRFGTDTVDSFGTFTQAETTAAGVLLDYAERTQKSLVTHLRSPSSSRADDALVIDAATRRNLELCETLNGERDGSLLTTIDHTVSAMGARLLYNRLMAPLRDLSMINARLDQVDYFVAHVDTQDKMRDLLRTMPDIERALARLSLGRGIPRDLAAMMTGLTLATDLYRILRDLLDLPAALETIRMALSPTPDAQHLLDTLVSALSDTLPATLHDGNFIRAGFHASLDQQRTLRDDGRRMILGLQQKYAQDTGVETLKIAHNNILGYYIDVTAKRADVLFNRPEHYIHRQTLAGNVRFTTTELAALERDLMQASERALAIELEIFKNLVDQILSHRPIFVKLSKASAELDVAAGLAHLAVHRRYARPTLTEGDDFIVRAGRHPVVEAALQGQNQPFVANDVNVSPGQGVWLVTGPNMAGKSTILRQNALMIILAQMGAFVPAESARIGIVDRLFSRVGASDDLAQGRSTFMVEMVETAAILNQATSKSFVILDEIGRGTATHDGLSIAWACLEYVHDQIGCRALFATHYHELTALAGRLKNLHLARLAVKEWQGDIVFLHQIEDGAAQGSYGIHVARLAGLPAAVTARAEQILSELSGQKPSVSMIDSLPLFSSAPSLSPARTPSALEKEMDEIDPDTLSPREALDALYALKKLRMK